MHGVCDVPRHVGEEKMLMRDMMVIVVHDVLCEIQDERSKHMAHNMQL